MPRGRTRFTIARWFDPANYTISKNPYYGNLWIQGGPRTRKFFTAEPLSGPALNKTPLVRWTGAMPMSVRPTCCCPAI